MRGAKSTINICLLLALAPALGGPARAQERDMAAMRAAGERLTPERLVALFNGQDANWEDVTEILEHSGPGRLAWGESYRLLAYVVMYEATGDTRYLDHLVHRFDAVLKVRDDRLGGADEIRNATLPAWASTKYTQGRRFCWIVHAGMLTYPAASFVRLVRENPDLRRRYGAKADEYLAAIEETVACFEPEWRRGPAGDEGYYFGRSRNKHLPLNQMNAMGRTLIQLHAVTGKPDYLDKATRLARFFKRRIIANRDGTYKWAYWAALDPSAEATIEDISHASINVDFACVCRANGIVFDESDMTAFARTLLNVVWQGDRKLAGRVDGSGDGESKARSLGRWLGLAAHEPAVADFVRGYYGGMTPMPSGEVPMLTFAWLLAAAGRHGSR